MTRRTRTSRGAGTASRCASAASRHSIRPSRGDLARRRRSRTRPKPFSKQASRIRPKAATATTTIERAASPNGMPHMMTAFRPLEFVITGDTFYVLIADYDALRQIYTDGRDWPKEIKATYAGYSIGKWIDTDGNGKFDVLEAETRGPFKGPRVFDASGLPLHADGQSIFKERFHLDKANPNILHDEITVIDHALTRPWSVDKRYVRNKDPRPEWPKSTCRNPTRRSSSARRTTI